MSSIARTAGTTKHGIMKNSAFLGVMLGAVLTLAGCNTYKPGGALQSHDTFTYYSEAHLPVTITVVDSRTQEAIFVNEVPVGKQLVIRFYDKMFPENQVRPAGMRWEVMPLGERGGELDSVMAVPGRDARRVDVTYRKAPEYPPAAPRVRDEPTQIMRTNAGPVK
ncbi:MAG: hypothetical protein SFY96_00845 [Planctomycetota bacterium]|nr:hypothetical protein [Planctomycetota bacterium]